jgi:thiol-disulfide isomerase/thioredoxin
MELGAAPLPGPGKHPYFSKHPKQWKQLAQMIRDTRQLTPIVPRRFSLSQKVFDHKRRVYALSMHQGETILLTRWATWCLSCKYALRAKRKLLKSFQKVPVAIIGVTHEPFSLVARYQKNAKPSMKFRTTLVDVRGRLARYFRGMAYPATALIDPWGWIIADRVGPGLWVTKPYYLLFHRLQALAPVAWKSFGTQASSPSPKRRR